MEPIRTQISKALKTAAEGMAPQLITDPVSVFRNKRRPPDTNAVRVWVNIITGDFDADDTISSDATRYAEEITVVGEVRAANDETAADERDDLYAATVVALMADHTLGGLTIDVRQVGMASDVSDSEGSEAVAVFSLTFEVDYETASGNPYQLPA